ncbi:MAG TPA: hypothetical protein VN441_16270 [Syntrophomonas sp.]|nr:hypothetical protein [Syntrophomonas sp.]
MFYYMGVINNKITWKMSTPVEQPGLQEVSEDIYNQLTYLPADFTRDDDWNILTVTPAEPPVPEPEPVTTEDRLTAVEAAILDLMGV